MFDSLGRENSAAGADPDAHQVSYPTDVDVNQVSYCSPDGPPNAMIQPAPVRYVAARRPPFPQTPFPLSPGPLPRPERKLI